MITTAILNFLLSPIYLLLDAIDVSLNVFTIPAGIFNGLNNLFGTIGYIFPVKELLPILTMSLVLTTLQFAITMVRSLINLIPTMGT